MIIRPDEHVAHHRKLRSAAVAVYERSMIILMLGSRERPVCAQSDQHGATAQRTSDGAKSCRYHCGVMEKTPLSQGHVVLRVAKGICDSLETR